MINYIENKPKQFILINLKWNKCWRINKNKNKKCKIKIKQPPPLFFALQPLFFWYGKYNCVHKYDQLHKINQLLLAQRAWKKIVKAKTKEIPQCYRYLLGP
jgi:hypothetical protein